jgi:hypothetical protein
MTAQIEQVEDKYSFIIHVYVLQYQDSVCLYTTGCFIS